MLEKINLNQKLSKAEYRAQIDSLRDQLFMLQKAVWEADLPVMIIFEGWPGSGKIQAIRSLTRRLDPRGYKIHAIKPPRTYETHYPWLWRYWMKIPSYGEIAIFNKSWYVRVLDEQVDNLISRRALRLAYQNINDFERTLADDNYTILKFWLHISQKEQGKRFERLEKDPLTAWQVSPSDWVRYEQYGKYLDTVEDMLEHTYTEWGPWSIIPATDRRFAYVEIYKTVIQVLQQKVGDMAELSSLPGMPEAETVLASDE